MESQKCWRQGKYVLLKWRSDQFNNHPQEADSNPAISCIVGVLCYTDWGSRKRPLWDQLDVRFIRLRTWSTAPRVWSCDSSHSQNAPNLSQSFSPSLSHFEVSIVFWVFTVYVCAAPPGRGCYASRIGVETCEIFISTSVMAMHSPSEDIMDAR